VALNRHLVNRGDSVTVICPPGPYILQFCAQYQSSPYSGCRQPIYHPCDDLRLFWTLYRIFRRERFDIVHNNTINEYLWSTGSQTCALRRCTAPLEGEVPPSPTRRAAAKVVAKGCDTPLQVSLLLHRPSSVLERGRSRVFCRVRMISGERPRLFAAAGSTRAISLVRR